MRVMNSTGAPKEPLRVAVILNDLHVGGVQRNVVAFAKHLDCSQFEMNIFCVCDGGPLVDDIRELGMPVTVFQGVWKAPVFSFIKMIRPGVVQQLADALRQAKIDIVQTRLFLGNTIGRRAALQAGVPVIVAAEHNTYYDKGWFRQRIDRQLAQETDRIVAVSDGVRTFTMQQESLPADKVVTIYNGLDFSKFDGAGNASSIRQEFSIPESAPLLGCLSRLVEYKHLDRALYVLRDVLKTLPEARLLVVGDGPDMSRMQALAKQLQVETQTIFTGNRDDTPDLYAAMDVFLHPSTIEGLPTVVLEAMAMKTAVIIDHCQAAPEIIEQGRNGYIMDFDKQLPDIVTMSCELLQDQEARLAMAAAAAESVRSRFSLQSMMAGYTLLWQELYEKNESLSADQRATNRRM